MDEPSYVRSGIFYPNGSIHAWNVLELSIQESIDRALLHQAIDLGALLHRALDRKPLSLAHRDRELFEG